MLGYSIALVVGLLLVALLIGAFGRRGRPAGRVAHDGPVERSQPAADEPTPSASRTASDRQAREAQRRTPPA
jgi:hypothetical protein